MVNKISEQDHAEFRHHMRDVKPLPQYKKTVSLKSIKQKIKRKNFLAANHLNIPERINNFSAEPSFTPTNLVSAEEILAFSRTGLQIKVLRKLKQGQFDINAKLDLHGLTSPQAFIAVNSFIYDCYANQFRCVCIVHGKGQRQAPNPILKNKINFWLREMKEVLAFHSAKPNHGGSGALYVLLKIRKTYE